MQEQRLPRSLRTLIRIALILAMIFIARAAFAQDPAPPKEQPDPYTSAPVAERIFITFTSATGESARSSVLFRFDPGKPEAPATPDAQPAPASPRLRLTLARLELLISHGRLIATYRGDSSNYFEATIPDPPTVDALRAALPPLPIPELQWCLGDTTQRTTMHPFGLPTTLVSTDQDGTRHYTASDGDLTVTLNPRSSRPRRIELRRHDASTLQLDIVPASIGDARAWDLPIENRSRVESIADLRRAVESTLLGKPLRDIGFTKPDLSPITLAAMLAGDSTPQPDAAPQSPSRPAVLLIFESAKDGSPTPAVRADLNAARALVNETLGPIANAPDTHATSPLFFLVRGLPLETLDIPAIESSANDLIATAAAGIGGGVVNTAAADWILKEQLGGCHAALLILNADRVVTCAAPLDNCAEDPGDLSTELESALKSLTHPALAPPK